MVDIRLSMIDTVFAEHDCNDTVLVEQYVQDVVDFSSQYGSDISISYTAYNISGKPSKFPDYGDFPQAFVMRTYGKWWNEAPSRPVVIMAQNFGRIISQDYIDMSFEQAVYPVRVSVYETYNPGSVVRIWACGGAGQWEMLWEGESQVVGHLPRIFSPNIRSIGFATNLLRLEFDHSKLEYYTELDAVMLVGTKRPVASDPTKMADACLTRSSDASPTHLTEQIMRLNIHATSQQVDLTETLNRFLTEDTTNRLLQSSTPSQATEDVNRGASGLFSCLPDETILNVLSFLDLVSLCRCARLNRHFRCLAFDSFLYTEINLRPYWHCTSARSLDSLALLCQHLQKLDLSWCGSYGSITPAHFNGFIDECGKQLTHLRLDSCKFVNDACIVRITEICHGIRELTLRNCFKVSTLGFDCIAGLGMLERLDLYRTAIETQPLVNILKASPRLRHINLGSCVRVSSMDEVAQALGSYNRQLVSVDFWKTYSLTPIGVRALSQCSQLEEVDFGWCLGVSIPGDCMAALATGCPRLRKLFMAALRGIQDRDVDPFLKHCPHLQQVDLLGVRSITADLCLRFLSRCKGLRLLDLSFCDQIKEEEVADWRTQFSHVSIKRSFQTEGGPGCNLPNHY